MQTPENQTYGPVSREELDRWQQEGRISADCLLRQGYHEAWKPPAELYPQLQPLAAKPTNTGSSFRGSSTLSQSGDFPLSGPRIFQLPHRGGLVLALGILSWIITCPILGILAWMWGSSDLREMQAGRRDPAGQGLTQAGYMLGMVNSILWIVVFLIVLFALLVVIAAQTQ